MTEADKQAIRKMLELGRHYSVTLYDDKDIAGFEQAFAILEADKSIRYWQHDETGRCATSSEELAHYTEVSAEFYYLHERKPTVAPDIYEALEKALQSLYTEKEQAGSDCECQCCRLRDEAITAVRTVLAKADKHE